MLPWNWLGRWTVTFLLFTCIDYYAGSFGFDVSTCLLCVLTDGLVYILALNIRWWFGKY